MNNLNLPYPKKIGKLKDCLNIDMRWMKPLRAKQHKECNFKIEFHKNVHFFSIYFHCKNLDVALPANQECGLYDIPDKN